MNGDAPEVPLSVEETAELHLPDRRRTALHEGGHSVADVIFGHPFECVSVRPGRGFSGAEVAIWRGRPEVDGFAPWLPSVAMQPTALRADVEGQVISLLVGNLASLFLSAEQAAADYSDSAVVEEIARQALVDLGPRLGELVVHHEQDETEGESDEQAARRLATALAGPEVGELYLGWLKGEAKMFVFAYKREILAVADALERRAVLTGDEVAAIVHAPRS